MADMVNGSEAVSVQGVINWALLLVIFSIITVIGNWVGYKHPMYDSLIGMLILSIITLAGLLLEKYLPFNISSLIYISIIGIVVSLPCSPTSVFVVKYVGQVELLAIVPVFLAYVGIGVGKNWEQFKDMGWKGILVTICLITGAYLGSMLIAHIVLVLSGIPG
jgi:hypothetical protein